MKTRKSILTEQLTEIVANNQDILNGYAYNINVEDFARRNNANAIEEQLNKTTEFVNKRRAEADRKAAIEAFYATEKGKIYKENYENRRNELIGNYEEAEADAIKEANELIQQLDPLYGVHSIHRGYLSFGYVENGVQDIRKPAAIASASEIEIHYNYDFWENEIEFTINVGSSGSFSPTEDNVQAHKYTVLGSLLANKTLCLALRGILANLKVVHGKISKRINSIDEKLKTPEF